MEELRAIASMPKEELVFKASVGVCEGTALWLEDGVDVLAQCDDIEPHKEVVVCQSHGMLCSGEGLPEADVEHRGVSRARFVECDEGSWRGDPSGCQGETGCGRDCERSEQGTCCERLRVQERTARAGGTAGASLSISWDAVGSTSLGEV